MQKISRSKGALLFLSSMMIYGCQFDIAWEDKVENFRRVRSLVAKHNLLPGSLFILPEMFATGFSMNAEKIVERKSGPTTDFLRQLARDNDVYVLGGLVRKGQGGKLLNEAICMAPSGKCVARYAKLQPFTPGGESDHFSAGHEVTIFRWAGLKVAVFVCYDLRFPELFRLAVQRGAEALVVIANWPTKRHSHWPALLKARAIENQAFVIGVNRCGHDPKLGYAGGSIVVDPRGKIVAVAGRRESILSAELDPSAPSRWRREFPALQDIRTVFRLSARQDHS
jgi:omega-amidase